MALVDPEILLFRTELVPSDVGDAVQWKAYGPMRLSKVFTATTEPPTDPSRISSSSVFASKEEKQTIRNL